ncbi:hypothetical protein HF888_09590 [Bermanella marisrubri]|uniref:DUF7674 domain-containing protein n=1 Tax=Bermanella marisrubri TaxID=207949 RepID=Q1N6B1_9GAMM|nr:hypothetical protein [Bermanella marisrubri]EAT13681.1 hypothetical protein RED65_09824 [Oceanobacter sp. RED65] [Bermanella marisrubri]QIZ84460.1 hypothetical protein HF888_09590 [Bermanella marisrubri]
MIDKEDAIKRLVKAYPYYLDELQRSMSSFLGGEGEILWFMMISSALSTAVTNSFTSNNYEFSDALFLEIENLIENGSQEVSDIVCTGFLESMQNQTKLPSRYWAPLLGKRATDFCKAMDDFHGVKTEGLVCYKA